MKRHIISPRSDWKTRVSELGMTYYTTDSFVGTTWDESVCYSFSMDEILEIENATEILHSMAYSSVGNILNSESSLIKLQIPREFWPMIQRSYNDKDPYVMGRMDLAFDPKTKNVKLLEYNADTPTMVIETALVQWFWKEEKFPNNDQFNSLHEKLIDQYKLIAEMLDGRQLVFSSIAEKYSAEEYNHVMYFMDLASQAGIINNYTSMDQIGWNGTNFVDRNNKPIEFWSKLYPWEWLVQEDFGKYLLSDQIGIIEPSWKMILSNKGILPFMWDYFKDDPNSKYLLETYWEPGKLTNFVEKPILSREGNNIHYHNKSIDIKTEGPYIDSNKIYQEVAKLGNEDGYYTVLGSWIVGENAAGMIIRENTTPIVVSSSKVVPHYIED